jgi:hypothetical protein
MHGKRRTGAPPPPMPPTPVDREAGANARTAITPANLEETEMAKKSSTKSGDGWHDGGGTQPIPEEPKPGLLERAGALLTGETWCDFCNAPAVPDLKQVSECARCRRVPLRKKA